MLITHHAHSEFLIETAQGFRILTDPFDDHVGYPMHDVACDAVTVSHGHGDHSYLAKAKGYQVVADHAGKITLATGVTVTAVPCFHDDVQGVKRGPNLISIIEADGLRVAHFGDLGAWDEDLAAQLEGLDIALIPVGGFYTIDADSAARLGLLTERGGEVLAILRTGYADAFNRDGDLTDLGARQHREIARRMFTNYRRVFRGRRHINANATQSPRVMLSMESFCQELLSLNPRLDISLDASARDRAFLAYETPEARVYGDEGPWREEWNHLRDSLVCPDRLMGVLFADPAYVQESVDATELTRVLYQLASIAMDSDTDVRLGDLFTTTEWYDLWQPHNYSYYMSRGPNPAAGEKTLERSSVQTLEHIDIYC